MAVEAEVVGPTRLSSSPINWAVPLIDTKAATDHSSDIDRLHHGQPETMADGSDTSDFWCSSGVAGEGYVKFRAICRLDERLKPGVSGRANLGWRIC